jgi:RHS repeat-associated protein
LDWQLTGRGRNRIDRAVTALDYDGGGRRLAQSYDPKAGKGGVKRTEYAFDNLDPVAEYNELTGQHDNYYRGDDGQISLSQHFNSGAAGQLHWYHYDRKGDVAGLTKQNGNAAHTYRYEPYGAVIPANGNFTDPHNHYTLTGKEFDENTGLVWFGARHYEPETGVWMGQDVYRGTLDEPMSLHRFGYVENNPVNGWDWYGFKNVFSKPGVCIVGKKIYAECYNHGLTGYMSFEDYQQIDNLQFEELQHAVYDNLKSYDDTTTLSNKIPDVVINFVINFTAIMSNPYRLDKGLELYRSYEQLDDFYEQLVFDTPFYNPYDYGWIRSYVPRWKCQVRDNYVHINGENVKRSDVNYFAMGMYYAKMNISEKEKINKSKPSDHALYWAKQGWCKYREYEREE